MGNVKRNTSQERTSEIQTAYKCHYFKSEAANAVSTCVCMAHQLKQTVSLWWGGVRWEAC